MFANLKKKNEGFTIIEVLIVLAIAGLIMLIVFLAVPALQRNARNTQRKNDVSALLGAISEYVSNANGALPTTAAQITANARLGFYTPVTATNVTYTVNTSATAPAGPGAGVNDVVQIHTNSKCNATGTAATATGASARSYIALYRVETGGGDTLQCQES